MSLPARTVALVASAVAAAVAGLWFLATGDRGSGSDQPNLRDAELVTLGQTLYVENCASCHGAQLEGEPNWRSRKPDGTLPAPPHDASGHTWHHPDHALFAITKLGGQAVAPPDFKSAMPGFGDTLSDREIWAVLAYIKSLWPEEVRERQEAISRRAQQ